MESLFERIGGDDLAYLALCGGVESAVRSRLAWLHHGHEPTGKNGNQKMFAVLEHARIDFAMLKAPRWVGEKPVLKCIVELGAFPPNGGTKARIRDKLDADHEKITKKGGKLQEFLQSTGAKMNDKFKAYPLLLFTHAVPRAAHELCHMFVKPAYRSDLNKGQRWVVNGVRANSNIQNALDGQGRVVAGRILANRKVHGCDVTLHGFLVDVTPRYSQIFRLTEA